MTTGPLVTPTKPKTTHKDKDKATQPEYMFISLFVNSSTMINRETFYSLQS